MFLSDVDLLGAIMFFGRQLLVVIAIYFVIILLMRMSGYYRLKSCPECGNQLKRSQRTLSDRLRTRFSLGLLPLKRYRCYTCYWEGAAFAIKKGRTSSSDNDPEDDFESEENHSEVPA